MTEKVYDLEDRLIDFAVDILNLIEKSKKSISFTHLKTQLLRSGKSPAANYGEAQAAESKADFIHKMKLVLKELRETQVWLKIINKSYLVSDIGILKKLMKENRELIAIIYSSIRTASNNI